MIEAGMVAAKKNQATGIQAGMVAAQGGLQHQKYVNNKRKKDFTESLIPPKDINSKAAKDYLIKTAANKTVQKIKNNEYVTPAQIDSAASYFDSQHTEGWAALKNPTAANINGKDVAKQISGFKNYYSLFKDEEDFEKNKDVFFEKTLPLSERLIVGETKKNLQQGELLNAEQRNIIKKYGISYFLGQLSNQSAYFDFMSPDNPEYKSFSEKAKNIMDKEIKGQSLNDEETDILENFLFFEDLRKNEFKSLGRLTTDRKTNSQNLSIAGAIPLYNDAAYGEDKTIDRLGLYVNTGMRGYLQDTADAVSIVLASVGGMGEQINEELSVRADSPYQIASNELRNYYKYNGQHLNIVIQDVVTNMARNAIPMMLSVVGGVGAKGSETLSKVLSTSAFAPSVFGGAYREGLQSGITDFGKLWAYSLATTVTECTLEMLLGSDKNPAGGVLSGKVISSLGKNLKNVFRKGVLNMVGNATGEFIEEGIQSILGPLFREWFLGTEETTIFDNPIESLSNAAYEGFIGALSATFMGGLSSFKQAKAEIGLLQKGRLYKNSVYQTGTDIKNIAQFFKESFNDKSVKKAADKVIKGDTSDLAVGELLNAFSEYSKENSNIMFATIGQNIQNVPNGVNMILSTYENAVETGSTFPDKITDLYDKIKGNTKNGNIDISTIGEFAYYVEAYAPRARVLGEVTKIISSQNKELQSSAESDIMNQNTGGGDNSVNQRTIDESVEGIRKRYFKKTSNNDRRYIPETAEAFAERASRVSSESGGRKRVLLSKPQSKISYMPADENSALNDIAKKLTDLGIKIFVCNGPVETNQKGVTVIHEEAMTTPQGEIFLCDSAVLSNKELVDHELVHNALRRLDDSYLEYEDVIIKNINYQSNYYVALCLELNVREFNNQYEMTEDGFSIEGITDFNTEIVAYVYQEVLNDPDFADKFYSNMFIDWQSVKNAVMEFNKTMPIDTNILAKATSENEATSFLRGLRSVSEQNSTLQSGEEVDEDEKRGAVVTGNNDIYYFDSDTTADEDYTKTEPYYMYEEYATNNITPPESQNELKNNIINGIINNKHRFNSKGDPLVEATGDAEISNPKEIEDFKKELKMLGVELKQKETENLGYAPGIASGQPGIAYISKGASYGAWCHEMQHVRDDNTAGWSGMRILMDKNEHYIREVRAYQLEMNIAERLGRPDIVDRLKENLEEERIKIYGK